ncbi:MAG: glutaminyl-peptide cyclotransferase [Candidatus Omnitrophota bacterium]|nr:glutaminyl-peptide cyclotransferase [Candidatus Omnitrophota bacterium]
MNHRLKFSANRILSIFLKPFFIFLLTVIFSSCLNLDTPKQKNYSYKIVNIYPHARDAFTQGLVFEDGILYEGTGLNGRSSLRKVDLKSGNVLNIHKLPDEFFGEGITVCEDKIIQLTWRSNTGFVYDKYGFNLIGKFSYPFEGWGITYDGRHLIASDGTDVLHFLNPDNFKEEYAIKVYNNDGPVSGLNELEYAQGKIYANIWRTGYIVELSPKTGRVTGRIDLSGLLAPYKADKPVDVLNGIAYNNENGHLFVTGKLWPKIFEIELVRTK